MPPSARSPRHDTHVFNTTIQDHHAVAAEQLRTVIGLQATVSANLDDSDEHTRVGPDAVIMVSAYGGPSAAIVVTGDAAIALAELFLKEKAILSDKESASPSAGAPGTWTKVKGHTPEEWASRNAQVDQFAKFNLKAPIGRGRVRG